MKRVLVYLGVRSSAPGGDQIKSGSPNLTIKDIGFSPASTKTSTGSPPSAMGQTPVNLQTQGDLNSTIKGIKFSPASTKMNAESPRAVVGQTPINFHSPATGAKGSKEETFFDSKAWLDSEDEDDFVSINGEASPVKQLNNGGDNQGRKLKELFLESSFGRDSQTSLKAEAINKDEKPMTPKLERKKSDRSTQRCLPSLVRTLSCGDRKKRLRTSHIQVVG